MKFASLITILLSVFAITAAAGRNSDGDADRLPAAEQGGPGTAPWLGEYIKRWKTPARWNWSYRSNAADDKTTVHFRRVFQTARTLTQLTFTADNEFWVFVDGQEIGHGNDWPQPQTYSVNLTPDRQPVAAVKVANWGGPGGLIAELR